MLKYGDALDASSAADVMALWDTDASARFMPNHYTLTTGTAAITTAYDVIFATISLTIKFDIVEVKVVSPEWAFACTNSVEPVKLLTTGTVTEVSNQELFVMHKVGGQWKIARYCFCSQA